MALEPSLWRTLPKELLHLVFAHLPPTRIGQLQVLSKEWKRNIDCKDSEFNRVFDATTHLKMFALMSLSSMDSIFVSLYDVEANKWHHFENGMFYRNMYDIDTIDGGLVCFPWQCRNSRRHLQFVVMNPLTRRMMRLPPLLNMGVKKFDDQVEMVQFTMDKKTKEYKVHVVGDMKTSGNGIFAQVYDSHTKVWSMGESKEGHIIGIKYTRGFLDRTSLCVYNYANRNLQHFKILEIARGLTVKPDCIRLINDHLFVLHKKAPQGSTNIVQDGESNWGKYCISEFHLPEKAIAWVKLKVHECDPSIYDSLNEKLYTLTLLACNGFLLIVRYSTYREDSHVWLYNLSTCAWRNLPNFEKFPRYYLKVWMLCKISWSALP